MSLPLHLLETYNWKRYIMAVHQHWCSAGNGQVADKLELVLTLGGDGTVLWTSALLGTRCVLPLVPFALGSLGFMTPFALDAMPAMPFSVCKAKCHLRRGYAACAPCRLPTVIVPLGTVR